MKKKYYIYKMNLTALTFISIILFIIPLFLTLFLYNQNVFNLSDSDYLLTLLFLFPYLGLHELLHSLSYVLHGANFKNITYGVCLEKGILYCLCKQNISKKNILLSLLYPFIFLGLITYMIGLYFHNTVLILLSILNISGCSGDIMMFLFISKLKNIEYSEFDDSTSFGIYTNENLESKKFWGLDYVEVKENLERNNLNKLEISKVSKLIFVLYIVILFIVFFM